MEKENPSLVQIGGIILLFCFVTFLIFGIFSLLTKSTTYNFGNGTRLVVPWDAFSVDHRDSGNGVAVEADRNVIVYNDSNEWRTLTVSYRTNSSILSDHAFEDLPPKSSKIFGADGMIYIGMHISISEYAQEKRNKEKKK